MASTWKEQLQETIVRKFGHKKGDALFAKYSDIFTPLYCDENTPDEATIDISHIQHLTDTNPIDMRFYSVFDKQENILHLRLYQLNHPIPLSDILPMIENLDLRIYSERPMNLKLVGENFLWISDFTVIYQGKNFNIEKSENLFREAFIKIYQGQAESDGFNKLILSAFISWREVMILRTYAKYLRQVQFLLSQSYIEKALQNNADTTRKLIELFTLLNDPTLSVKVASQSHALEKEIIESLNKVESLDEDRILRRFVDLIKATLRTNYFQTTEEGQDKDYLAIKLNSRSIPDLPMPVPLYEIFVYSTRFEGIHLRNAKVARGGIRWSDRLEDFRTEILSLMKAQTVKNAVIVPSGAKGGFVLKKTTHLLKREDLQAEVIICYTKFISALLDITDNIVDKKIIPPRNVICHDEGDPYLVVAADKGTATFSDIANSIAFVYHFWLGDAFASGGKTGYDHKKIGITARGAWESIKRNFRELEIIIGENMISVVGIGDMSGDVFGNGMLYTKKMKLVAAFDHRHIFIDPDPNPEVSYAERERLFLLSTSSWADYNANLISKGGGVFARHLKSISLTPEMRQLFATDAHTLSPNELIRTILKAPVDLIYNGGIGTYVKASTESNGDVGDKTNDYCRVNGDELRCKVVGEGGNLGFTQRGRIEYALNGGIINTDFIDNSGGVDCSDHEVNLKILLQPEVLHKKLSVEKRNVLLADLTQEVADLVLADNYDQALVMSFSAFHAKKNMSLHINYIQELESANIINRHVEYLPNDKELAERKTAGLGLTRPELAILLAYTKIHLKAEILKTALPEDPYLMQSVALAFPPSIRRKYAHAMREHSLHRDIIATQISNEIVNEMGITFVYRIQVETGAILEDIIRAYTVASYIFGAKDLQNIIQSLDHKISITEQYDMLFHVRNLISLSTRWFLHNSQIKLGLEKLINHYSDRIRHLTTLIPSLMSGTSKDYMQNLVDRFLQAGVPMEVAEKIATYRAIYTALNIIDVATQNNFDLIQTAKVYFACGERVNLVWLREQIANDSRDGHWNTMARLTLRDELDLAQRLLTIAIINNDKHEKEAMKMIEKWAEGHQHELKRWDKLLTMLISSTNVEYTMFFIILKELFSLIEVSQNR